MAATILVCPQCGTQTLRGQTFCGKCGEQLTSCKACGSTNLVGNAFCHNCGKQLTAPAETSIDERVLKYLAASKGEISITQASQELGIDRERLMESLSRLQAKGEIQFHFKNA